MANPFEEIEKKTHQYSYRATSPVKLKSQTIYTWGSSSVVNCKACFVTVPSSIISVYQPVTPVVSYLPTGLAECSVGPGISCGARKLARTLRVIKKKKKMSNHFYLTELRVIKGTYMIINFKIYRINRDAWKLV
jgi:hypothetical protein